MRTRFITFLTDFGLQDDFVGVCHGVMKRIAPDVEIIDVTHGITPQSILQGALTLANAVPYLPVGIHVAVVDPGVGGSRRAVALEGSDGRVYVGPDNGLLLPVVERMGGLVRAHCLENPAYALEDVSPTFHARDVFSPAAAHLALGVPLEELGQQLAIDTLVRLDLPQPQAKKGRLHAVVIDWDRFGNIQLNLRREHIDAVGIEPGARVELEHAGERYYAVAARTFTDARPGDIILFEDSYGNIAVAISGGNAAEMLAAATGDEIHVLPLLGQS